jgi:hypothetical protein
MRQRSIVIRLIGVVAGAIFAVFDVLGWVPLHGDQRLWALGAVLVVLLGWAEVQRMVDTRPKLAFLPPKRQLFRRQNLPTTLWRIGVVNHGAPTDVVVRIEAALGISDEAGVPTRTLHSMGDNQDNGRGYQPHTRAETDIELWLDFVGVTKVDAATLGLGTRGWVAAVEAANSGQEDTATAPVGGGIRFYIASIEYDYHTEVVPLPARSEFTVLVSGGGQVKRQRLVVEATRSTGELDVAFAPSLSTGPSAGGVEKIAEDSLQGPGESKMGLSIVAAKYGASDRWVDVTDYVAQQIMDDRVDMDATNATLGGDPIYGLVKTLRVTFALGSEALRTVEVSENERLSIPEAPA